MIDIIKLQAVLSDYQTQPTLLIPIIIERRKVFLSAII